MELDKSANLVINGAYDNAIDNNHEYITPEHLLYSMLDVRKSIDILKNLEINIEDLRDDLGLFIDENMDSKEEKNPEVSMGFNNVLNSAAVHVTAAGKEYITVEDLLVAIYDEENSFASYFLKKQGLDRLSILEYISHGDFDDDYEVDEDDDEYFAQEKDLLEKYTENLIEKARRDEFDPLIGREDVVKRTMQVLCRRNKNNPIHVGESGVGKTAITEGIAKLIAEENVPEPLKGSDIFHIDMGSMLAGTKYRGDFEERMKKVLKEVEKKEKPIIYIDEIHTIVGAGAVQGGAMDASNIMKPFLQNGKIRFIGATTYNEYKKFFEKDKALSRRFQKIEISEPDIENTYLILKGLKGKYEDFHNVEYTDKALRVAAELSAKYINDRHLPDKALDVIDEAGADKRLRVSEEKAVIDEPEIEKIVSFIAKIPEKSVSTNEKEKLQNLELELKEKIFGQDDAVNTVVKAIKRSRAGFNEETKPVASLLFVGPTGVGKTELSKQIANVLGISFLRFDMSEYQEKHTVSRLVGAPPGYVGYEEGGLLTDAIRKNPYCVLLLDEIEKAHSDIYNILLQIMDYATLTDNNGNKSDFRNVIIVMTSNAGAREVGRKMLGFGEREIGKSSINKAVERIFSPEFRNRLDETVVFNKLDEQMSEMIAKKGIQDFAEKLKDKNVEIEATTKCVRFLSEKGINSIFGAREILRFIQEKIKTWFVDEVLFGKLENGGSVNIDIDNNNELVFNVVNKEI